LHRREGPGQPWRRASRRSRILARASDLGRTGQKHPPEPRRSGERRARGLRADGGTGSPRPAHRRGTTAVRRRATANGGPAMTRQLVIVMAAGGLALLAAVAVWREMPSDVHGVIRRDPPPGSATSPSGTSSTQREADPPDPRAARAEPGRALETDSVDGLRAV